MGMRQWNIWAQQPERSARRRVLASTIAMNVCLFAIGMFIILAVVA